MNRGKDSSRSDENCEPAAENFQEFVRILLRSRSIGNYNGGGLLNLQHQEKSTQVMNKSVQIVPLNETDHNKKATMKCIVYRF